MHTDKRKEIGEGTTQRLEDIEITAEFKYSINFVASRNKF